MGRITVWVAVGVRAKVESYAAVVGVGENSLILKVMPAEAGPGTHLSPSAE